MGPGAYLAPTFAGKGAFLNLNRSTSASGYQLFRCYVTMLQCRIRGRGTGNAGEWESLTQGTQGEKTKTCRSTPASRFSQFFAFRDAAN